MKIDKKSGASEAQDRQPRPRPGMDRAELRSKINKDYDNTLNKLRD